MKENDVELTVIKLFYSPSGNNDRAMNRKRMKLVETPIRRKLNERTATA